MKPRNSKKIGWEGLLIMLNMILLLWPLITMAICVVLWITFVGCLFVIFACKELSFYFRLILSCFVKVLSIKQANVLKSNKLITQILSSLTNVGIVKK